MRIPHDRYSDGVEAEQLSRRAQPPSTDRAFITSLVLLALGVLVLHDVEYLLTHPFWLDEAWVAVLSFLSIDELRQTAPGVPLGWLLLMRWIPGEGDQRFRLLPLAFSGASVIVSGLMVYSFSWTERWQARTAGIVAGAAVALTPAALLRNDLKQYTADAFFALLILYLASRLDQYWSRTRFVTLVIVGLSSAVVSYVSMFVTAAVFLSLLIVAIRTDRSQIPEVLIGGVLVGIAFLAIASWLVLPRISSAFYDFWDPFYLSVDTGIPDVAHTVWRRIDEAMSAAGLGSALAGVLLGLLGATALTGLRRPRVSASLLLLILLMMALGFLQKYPFLDIRTSHFLIITFVAIAITGVMFPIIHGLRTPTGATFAAIGLLMAALIAAAWPHLRYHSIPNEDVRSQVRFVEDAILLGDIVLVNGSGSFGVTYYWRSDPPVFVDKEGTAAGFFTQLERDDFVYTTGRTRQAIESALDTALAAVGRTDGRLWIIRSHVNEAEAENWKLAFAERSIEPAAIQVGPEPLLVIESDA